MRRINAKVHKSKRSQKRGYKQLDTSRTDRRNSLDEPTGKRKRGRRTTNDNYLLGARNGWLAFFEKTWHQIGWHLLQIRQQETGTHDDIRRIFEAVRGGPGFHWADFFLRGVPQAAKGTERRANNKRAVALQYEIQKMRSQEQKLESTCAYAESAVKLAGASERGIIELDANQKKERLRKLRNKLRIAENESKELEQKVREEETHFYCSELLGFLLTGKYAVKPLPLANSLAGLPLMGWRQSLARCSKEPPTFSQVQYPYGIVRAILKIWRRRAKNPDLALTDLFRAEIPKLRKPNGEARTYLSEGWRDLRMAVELCSREKHPNNFMPYAITRAFVSNRARSKNHAEQILEEHERLPT
jgi:hypothetical protein